MDDATLKALLAEDGLAERDPVFTYAVMQGVARRRLAGDLLDLTPFALSAAALLWLLAPQIEAQMRLLNLDLIGPVAIALVVSASVLAPLRLLSPRRMTET